MSRRWILAGLVALLAAPPVVAVDFGFGFLRRRQAKPDPASQVKAWVQTLQSDPDAAKRKQAAEELRNFDLRNHPEIAAGLTAAVQRDPSVDVRVAAVDSLGRMKPVLQSAGLVMEAALATDPDPKVREAVRSALWAYHLNGYRTAGGTPLTSQTPEPPLAPVTVRTAKPSDSLGEVSVGFRPVKVAVGPPLAYAPTPEPPLAKPRPAVPAKLPSATGLPLPPIPVAPAGSTAPRRNF